MTMKQAIHRGLLKLSGLSEEEAWFLAMSPQDRVQYASWMAAQRKLRHADPPIGMFLSEIDPDTVVAIEAKHAARVASRKPRRQAIIAPDLDELGKTQYLTLRSISDRFAAAIMGLAPTLRYGENPLFVTVRLTLHGDPLASRHEVQGYGRGGLELGPKSVQWCFTVRPSWWRLFMAGKAVHRGHLVLAREGIAGYFVEPNGNNLEVVKKYFFGYWRPGQYPLASGMEVRS